MIINPILRSKDPFEQRYRCMWLLWELFVNGAEEHDVQEMRMLHQRLCEEEQAVYALRPDLCLENLMQRLRFARNLGMTLSTPAWASQSIVLARLNEDAAVQP